MLQLLFVSCLEKFHLAPCSYYFVLSIFCEKSLYDCGRGAGIL